MNLHVNKFMLLKDFLLYDTIAGFREAERRFLWKWA